LNQAQEEFLRRDSDIRRLEKALEDERRKSMLDEQAIRQLEAKLIAKVNEASEHYNNYAAAQEKFELTEEEIERLKQ
jgi:hypothetical protein